MFFKNFHLNKKYKNEIEGNNEKGCSRFRHTASKKIIFTAYGVHIDHPPAWKLKFPRSLLKLDLILKLLIKMSDSKRRFRSMV